MSEKLTFPINVITGKYYRVPHVKVFNWYADINNVDIPISSPMHEDKEIIGVSGMHFHVDWRFIEKGICKKITKNKNRWHEGAIAEIGHAVFEQGSPGMPTTDKNVFYKTVKAKREYHANSFFKQNPLFRANLSRWPERLQAAYCGKELKLNDRGQYVCPHKGAIVDLKLIDENGNAVCPAHILRFDVNTLKAVHVTTAPEITFDQFMQTTTS